MLAFREYERFASIHCIVASVLPAPFPIPFFVNCLRQLRTGSPREALVCVYPREIVGYIRRPWWWWWKRGRRGIQILISRNQFPHCHPTSKSQISTFTTHTLNKFYSLPPRQPMGSTFLHAFGTVIVYSTKTDQELSILVPDARSIITEEIFLPTLPYSASFPTTTAHRARRDPTILKCATFKL